MSDTLRYCGQLSDRLRLCEACVKLANSAARYASVSPRSLMLLPQGLRTTSGSSPVTRIRPSTTFVKGSGLVG
jgi:hypothetical protein